MADYGQDLELIVPGKGSMDIDLFSELQPTDARIVNQAAIAKIMANDETMCVQLGFKTADYWWTPATGCNVPGALGQKYNPAKLQTVAQKIQAQCQDDPQIQSFTASVLATSPGVIQIETNASINGTAVSSYFNATST